MPIWLFLTGNAVLWTLFIAIFVLLCITFEKRRARRYARNIPTLDDFLFWRYLKLIRLMQGKQVPIICVLMQVISGICQHFYKDGIFFFWLPCRIYVAVSEAEYVKVLINHPDVMEKAPHYKLMKCVFGDGLLLSNGKKWFHRRKQVTLAFHLEVLRGYISVFNEQSLLITEKIRSMSHRPWIEIDDLISQCVLNIISDSTMGSKVSFQLNKTDAEDYLKIFHDFSEICIRRVMRPWTYNDTVYFRCYPTGRNFLNLLKRMKTFVRKVIEDKKSDAKHKLDVEHVEDSNYGKCKKAFLELMVMYHLKDPSFTIEDIADEVNTVMAGGHDTTVCSMKWILFLLGLHPDVQEKLFEEQNSLFKDDPHRTLVYEDTGKMKYTECVIKEALRLYPPLPIIGRITRNDIVIGNKMIPKDSYIGFNIYSLHRNPKVFPEPEKFVPERFLPENSSDRHPYAFIPFSAGPRNCVGQKFAMLSMKVQLSHLLRTFKVTSLDHRDEVNVMWKLTLENVKPIRIKFTPR